MTLSNRSNENIRITEVYNPGSAFTVKVVPLMVGRRYALQIASAANLKPGTHSQVIKLKTDSESLPEITLLLEVEVGN